MFILCGPYYVKVGVVLSRNLADDDYTRSKVSGGSQWTGEQLDK